MITYEIFLFGVDELKHLEQWPENNSKSLDFIKSANRSEIVAGNEKKYIQYYKCDKIIISNITQKVCYMHFIEADKKYYEDF